MHEKLLTEQKLIQQKNIEMQREIEKKIMNDKIDIYNKEQELKQLIFKENLLWKQYSEHKKFTDFDIGDNINVIGVRFTKYKDNNDYTSIIKTDKNEIIKGNFYFNDSIMNYLLDKGLHPKNYTDITLNKKMLITLTDKRKCKNNDNITAIIDISEVD